MYTSPRPCSFRVLSIVATIRSQPRSNLFGEKASNARRNSIWLLSLRYAPRCMGCDAVEVLRSRLFDVQIGWWMHATVRNIHVCNPMKAQCRYLNVWGERVLSSHFSYCVRVFLLSFAATAELWLSPKRNAYLSPYLTWQGCLAALAARTAVWLNDPECLEDGERYLESRCETCESSI